MAVVIKYQMNDPTTPDLVVETTLPPLTPGFLFRVMAMPTVTPTPGTREEQAGRVYVCLANLTNFISQFIKKHKPTVTKWAATNSLQVNTRAGKDLNAYYDRAGLKFMLAFDQTRNKWLYTCDSMDIVTHECGHAILDALRPDWWSVQNLEIWALHEAFGDITAIAYACTYDKLIERAFAETGGDLRKSNLISRLADEVGQYLFRVSKDKTHLPNALRDAVNNFVYVDPKDLPKDGPDNTIVFECHSFARILVGSWYDIMIGIFEELTSQGMERVAALKQARNVAYSFFIAACCKTPNVVRITEAVAKMMMEHDRLNGGVYLNIMKKVFTDRNIVKEIKMLSTINQDDIKGNVTKLGDYSLVTVSGPKKVKLANKYVTSMYVKGTDLSNVDVIVSNENMYLFDENGILVDEITSTEDEVYEAAMQTISHIREANDVGPHPDTQWEVKNGELHRSSIQCSCCR